MGEIRFADFNNDGSKDILVQNISDVRSNYTYYLYLYHPKTRRFKKVKGFEEIKNPIFNATDNIVESYVVSGEDWLGFYNIRNYVAVDLKIQVMDIHSDHFETDYQKAIKKIKKRK